MSRTTTLISDLYSGLIDKKRFIHQYFEGKQASDEYLLNLFARAVEFKDSRLVDEAMVLLSVGEFTDSLFVERLCGLLFLDWHRRHEDVANKLKEIADPNSVDCLFKAAEIQFDYLGYDERYQFARKCIKAIAAIESNDAVHRLDLLAKSSNAIISEYAFKELRYKRNGTTR